MMAENDLAAVLAKKMQIEQDQFKDWLMKQPPQEILQHTYQYTVKEDILAAHSSMELSAGAAQALLSSPSPLEDIYRLYLKWETDYMDTLRSCIKERARELSESAALELTEAEHETEKHSTRAREVANGL